MEEKKQSKKEILASGNIYQKLLFLQQSVQCPKTRPCPDPEEGWKWRSAEDILSAVKGLLAKAGCVILMKDEPILVGRALYMHSTVTLLDCASGESVQTECSAREDLAEEYKCSAQISGSAASYARKYALCGLLAIDGSTRNPVAQDPDAEIHYLPKRNGKDGTSEEAPAPEKATEPAPPKTAPAAEAKAPEASAPKDETPKPAPKAADERPGVVTATGMPEPAKEDKPSGEIPFVKEQPAPAPKEEPSRPVKTEKPDAEPKTPARKLPPFFPKGSEKWEAFRQRISVISRSNEGVCKSIRAKFTISDEALRELLTAAGRKVESAE